MQALELVVTEFEIGTGEVVDRCHGLRIVGRKLREHQIARGEQLAGAGDIGDVRVHLAGEDREVLQPVPVSYTHLRAHETPEHLVCRLLLEKKKKKKKQKKKKKKKKKKKRKKRKILCFVVCFFFFNDTATTEIYT